MIWPLCLLGDCRKPVASASSLDEATAKATGAAAAAAGTASAAVNTAEKAAISFAGLTCGSALGSPARPYIGPACHAGSGNTDSTDGVGTVPVVCDDGDGSSCEALQHVAHHNRSTSCGENGDGESPGSPTIDTGEVSASQVPAIADAALASGSESGS